jgi:hypothetical protein
VGRVKNPKGNPNPSPETRFGAGVSGNPIGKTSEQRHAEIINAQLSTQIQTRFLSRLMSRLEDEGTVDEAINAALDKLNLNSLLKDAADRGFGTPKASIDLINSDGSLRAPDEEAVLAAMARMYAAKSKS